MEPLLPDHLFQPAANAEQLQALMNALTARVIYLLEREAEAFFQLMYRLDIPERQLQEAFGAADPPAAIAQLIYDRQLEKAARRAATPARKEDDNDLHW